MQTPRFFLLQQLRNPVLRYAFSFVVALAAFYATREFHLQSTPYWTAYGAVVVTAYFGGFGATLVTAALSVVLVQGWMHLGSVHLPMYKPSMFLVYSCMVAGLAFFRDRSDSERDKTQKASIHANSILAAVVESSDDAIISETLDGIITSWNRGAERHFGYFAEEAVGCPITIIIPPDKRDEETRFLARIRNGERVEHYETVRLRKDGSTVDVSLTLSPIRDEFGEIAGASKIARDITARKQSERQHRELEARQNAFLDNLPVGVWFLNADGKLFYGNAEGKAIWAGARYVGVEQLGEYKGWWHGTDRQLKAEDWAAARAVMKGETSLGELIDIECFDGTKKTILNSAVPVRDSDSSNLGAVIINQDVTKQIADQESLRRSEEFSRSIIESSGDCIKLVSLDGHLTYISPSAQEVLECPNPSTLVGSYWPDFFEGTDRDALLKAMELAKQGQQGRFQGISKTFAGTPKWWDVMVVPMRDASGKPEQLLAVSRDITAMVISEQKLRSAERRLNVAQTATNSGAWEWDIKAGELWWSEGVWTLHGYEPHSFPPSYDAFMETLVAPEDRVRVQAAVDSALQGRAYEVEYRTTRPDGTLRYIVSRGQTIFDAAGEPESMVGIAVDVTERKLSEELLRRTEQLAAAGRLAATIAHEINNPLESLTNLVFLARNHPVDANKYLETADQELRRVALIAKQTLSFYKTSSHAEPVSLPELLNGVLDVYGRKLSMRGVRVVKRYETDEPVVLQTAEARQVFSNLIANAVDAMPQGGLLVLHVKPSMSDKIRGVTVVVADSGSGISPEQRASVFQPFFTTKENGTGLGLWVAKGIVEKNGGSLRMRSSTAPARSGTAFAITFPAQAEHMSKGSHA